MNDFDKKKNDFIEYCLKKDNTFPNHKLPKLFLDNEKETVFIEFRLLPYTIFIIKNIILKLGSSWSHTIICGNNNYDFYKNDTYYINIIIAINYYCFRNNFF